MTALRKAVAAARQDPECSTVTDPHAFRHIPNTVGVPAPTVEECVVADMHAFTEWLAMECYGADMVAATEWIGSVPSLRSHRLSEAKTAEVAHLGRTTRHPDIMLACRDEIERRWLASPMREGLTAAVLHDCRVQEVPLHER